jgi:hypothetical protein
MIRVESGSPNRLKYEESSSLKGLGQVVAGLFAAVGVWIMAHGYQDHPWLTIVFQVIAGFNFIVPGLLRMTRHLELGIDREKGIIESREGSFISVRRSHRIDDCITVKVTLGAIRHFIGPEFFYPIALLGLGIEKELCAPRDKEGARRAAEEIACFLGFGLIDSTSGESIEYRPEEVGLALGARLKTKRPPALTEAMAPAVQDAFPGDCPPTIPH